VEVLANTDRRRLFQNFRQPQREAARHRPQPVSGM
jgi:hypothetical protein